MHQVKLKDFNDLKFENVLASTTENNGKKLIACTMLEEGKTPGLGLPTMIGGVRFLVYCCTNTHPLNEDSLIADTKILEDAIDYYNSIT